MFTVHGIDECGIQDHQVCVSLNTLLKKQTRAKRKLDEGKGQRPPIIMKFDEGKIARLNWGVEK